MRLFAFTLCALVATPITALGQDLPPGPGADLIQQACVNCHGVDTVVAEHHDIDGWRTVVSEMIGNGAALTDAQAETVSSYLATNFGIAPADAAAPAAAPATPATPAAPADAAAAPAPAAQTPPMP